MIYFYIGGSLILGTLSLVSLHSIKVNANWQKALLYLAMLGGYLVPVASSAGLTTPALYIASLFSSELYLFMTLPFLVPIGSQVGYVFIIHRLFPSKNLTPEKPLRLNDAHWKRRKQAVQAYQQRFQEARTNFTTFPDYAIRKLSKRLDDSHEQVRKEAVIALGYSGHAEAVQPLLNRFARADEPLQTEILLALGRLEADKALPLVLDTLDNPADALRKAAVFALGYFRDARILPRLLNMLDDPSKEVREAVTHALSELLPLIRTVVFGEKVSAKDDTRHTVQNPPVTHLDVPMSRLQTLEIYDVSVDFYQLERFLTYAVNVIGQKYLAANVDAHIYGIEEQLHANLRNTLRNVCRSVICHHLERGHRS